MSVFLVFFSFFIFLVLLSYFIAWNFTILFGFKRKGRIISTIVLTLSVTLAFIGIMNLGSRQGIFFNSLYYFNSNILGFYSNLFWIIFAFFALFSISKIFKINFEAKKRKIVGIGLLIFCVIFHIYGVINAQIFVTRQIEIQIKDLPESWEKKNVVLVSDWHIGTINGEKFLNKIVEKLNTLNPDVLLIPGDFFDSSDDNMDYVVDILKKLEVKDGIYFVNGNHDGYFGETVAYDLLIKSGINVLSDEFVILDGVQIVGVDYYGQSDNPEIIKKVFENLKNAGYDENLPSILLYHSPVNIKDFANNGINLQVSGHTHLGQLFPYRFVTDLVYDGKDYGGFRDGDYYLYTTNGIGTWGPPLRTFNRPEIVILGLSNKKNGD